MGRFIKPKAITRKQLYKYLLNNFYISEVLAELIAVEANNEYLYSAHYRFAELQDIIMTLDFWEETLLGEEFWALLSVSTPALTRKN